MLAQDTRNRITAFIQQITGLGLKLGIPILILAVGYLLNVLFGDKARNAAAMLPADRAYLMQSIELAALALKWSSIVVVASIILRFFYAEIVGIMLTIVGAAIYFGIPVLYGRTAVSAPKAAAASAQILSALCLTGLISLTPGIWLVLRDSIVRIWRGISDKRVMQHRLAGTQGMRHRTSYKPLNSCWDMAYCKDFLRAVCPAHKARKSCWRLKVGCNCSDQLILHAVTGQEADNDHHRGIMDSLGLNGKITSPGTAKMKRARCRRCSIYILHQREKYRLLCPMMFPAVGLAFYWASGWLKPLVASGIGKADKFFSFMTTSTTSAHTSAANTEVATILALAWLAIIALCYSLRTLEYLIFDLQV